MKDIHAIISQPLGISEPEFTITGTTVNIGTIRRNYIRTNTFQQLYGIHARTLSRYRDEIIESKPEAEQNLFFIQIEKKFYYHEKILEYRTYGKDKNVTEKLPTKKTIVNGNETFRSGITNWISQQTWDYKAGCNYENHISFDGSRKKMELLFDRMKLSFPLATVKLFYSIEENPGGDGHHNHFLVSISGADAKNKKRKIQQLIVSIGGKIHECKKYDPKAGREFVRYTTKTLGKNQECWNVLSNEDETNFKTDFNDDKKPMNPSISATKIKP